MKRRLSAEEYDRFRSRFRLLYGDRAQGCLERLEMMIGRYGVGYSPRNRPRPWSEKDVVLITYGDSLVQKGQVPLLTLTRFLVERLKGAIGAVHLLPFFPYSSDDGFSITDYREVNPALGNWSAVHSIGRHFDLMFDLVLNHASSQSKWFRDYVSGIAPERHYFLEVEPNTDLGAVVRPRSLPLTRTVQTRNGKRSVWTTFSADQVDLDFSNPDVLFEFLDILMLYVSHGVRIVRLDAVAYLWKKIGTSCIHLAETHEIVKLIRDFVGIVAPGVLLITETNVPHEENVRYFGDGDEAHMVYQFALPPLLLLSLQSGDGSALREGIRSLGTPPPGCTFFNFTASHDGIGVRPLEGLASRAEIESLARDAERRGGKVSTRRQPDGTDAPYELNLTYFDALAGAEGRGSALHRDRFLCSQTIALELRGIPAVYIQSLTATRNDYEAVERTGRARSINRKRWDESELEALLDDPTSVESLVFGEYARRLRVRRSCRALHPDGPQEVLDTAEGLFALRRASPDGKEKLLCVNNLTAEPRGFTLDPALLPAATDSRPVDLLRRRRRPQWNHPVRLAPYESCWISVSSGD